MDTNKKIFSTAVRTQWDDGSFELSYDGGVIRVGVVSSAGAELPTDCYLLQALIGFECTNPKCLSGIPPVLPNVPCTIEVQMPAEVQTLPGGQQVLLVGADDSRISIPIFDVSPIRNARLSTATPSPGVDSVLCECDELRRYRHQAKIVHMAFHVYKITGAPDELAALRGKQIALPIPVPMVPASSQMAI